MDLKLKDLRALVCGSSRGLGYATALCLAAEGARVVVNSRKPDGAAQAAESIRQQTGNVQVHAIAGDVADPQVPAELVSQAAAVLGGLDILITNSGGPTAGSFASLDDTAWQAAVELNLLSHVRLIRAALPYLEQSPAASVLTVTSYSVKQPIPGLVLSNSVRAATVGLTKTLSLELGPLGIRVNSILPGWTETERVTVLMSARAAQNQTSIEEEIQKQAAASALGRLATPEEFANAAVFLVSPAAAYITGVMLTVDGGTVKGTL
ncbi:MAG TPA: SDR family oxidoreductase [Anaerolineales bacterium]|nr:SDR family oxidoreductase [Anaerolineales bacterium]